VLNSRQFKKDCSLLKIFAMASARAAEPEEEGVDEGIPADGGAKYIRTRKATDLEAEAGSGQHQLCHYPKNHQKSVLQDLSEGVHDGAARKYKGGTETIGHKEFRGSQCR